MKLSVLYAALFLTPSVAIASLIDVTPPELLGLTINPNTVDVTSGEQTVDVTFEFTDDLSGLEIMWLSVSNPSGTYMGAAFGNPEMEGFVSGDVLGGILETSFTIPEFAEAGDYTYSVRLEDKNNNVNNISYDQLVSMGFGEQLSVVSATQDTLAPELLGLTINPNTVDVTSGEQTVDVTFEFTDDLSGLEIMWLSVSNPSGTYMGAAFGNPEMEGFVSGDVLGGILETSFTIPEFAEAGDYTYSVRLEDKNNNVNNISYDQLVSMGFGEQLSVVSATQDTLAPELLGLTINPNTVDVTSGEQTVDVTFEFTDDLSGLEIMWLSVSNPSGTYMGAAFGNPEMEGFVSGDVLGGILETSFTIPEFAEAGDYTYSVRLEDKNNNVNNISYDQLVSMGFGEQLNVGAISTVSEPRVFLLASLGLILLMTSRRRASKVSLCA